MEIIRAIRNKGLKVPEDIAVVGFGSALVHHPLQGLTLTTLELPLEEIGRMAAEKVIKLIHKEKTPKEVLVRPKLTIGDSCGADRVT